MSVLYTITKKSYTSKKRTSIAIDPDLTKRINKVLSSKDKLSDFARNAIDERLRQEEIRAVHLMTDTEQFHKIRNLETDVKELKRLQDILRHELQTQEKQIKRAINDKAEALADRMSKKLDKIMKKKRV